VGAESIQAFVPNPLPPDPPIALDGPLQQQLEQALLSLGRLDNISALLPGTGLFLYAYVRKEAVLSSQIEGTQSTLSDLLLFEMGEAPGVPLEDVTEVSNYVAALEHGLDRLRHGFPLSNRLIRELHGILLSRGRGSGRDPGNFRRSQNWIGGGSPASAIFVPPPPNRVEDCVAALERFIAGEGTDLPVLVRAALAHVQFETIHPFLDGNGRVGRLLISLMLCDSGVLREPLLYLSLFLRRNRKAYYTLLNSVRSDGDWEAWLAFFIEGVRQTADGAVGTARHLGALFAEDREKILPLGRRAGSVLRIHESLKARPLARVKDVSRRTGLSIPAVARAMRHLEELAIAREITGGRRNRVYAYDQYMKILNEGEAGE
jgi:Fic family protein